MSDQIEQSDDTLLEFPCEFRVKAMGLVADDFEQLVFNIVQQHCPSASQDQLRSRMGKSGKYVSVTITIQASNKPQLDAIYMALNDHERIAMTL